MAVEPPYFDTKTILTNAAVNNPKGAADEFTEKTAVVENGAASSALDPRAKTTDAFVIPR